MHVPNFCVNNYEMYYGNKHTVAKRQLLEKYMQWKDNASDGHMVYS